MKKVEIFIVCAVAALAAIVVYDLIVGFNRTVVVQVHNDLSAMQHAPQVNQAAPSVPALPGPEQIKITAFS